MAELHSQSARQELWDDNYELIRSYIRRVLYLRPNHVPPKEFFDSTLSRVHQNFIRRVDGFDGRNWEAWLYKVVLSAARDEVRSIIGRGRVSPIFVPLHELDHPEYVHGPAANPDHHAIIEAMLDLHEKEGPRAAKSARAIRLRFQDGEKTDEIAARLETTKAYVEQLFSHDYPRLREILREKFGLDGKSL